MEQQPPRDTSVFVSNISPNATEKSVAEFFSFCGIITSITIRPSSESKDAGVQEAIVEFDQEAATKTALLLTNALIVDRPITVVRYTAKIAEGTQEQGRIFHKDEIQNKSHQLPASQRTQTSVIASLIAAGYKVGADALKSAREYDEEHMITANIYSAAGRLNTKAQELDKEYKISETANAWTNAAVEKIAEVDQRLGVTTTVSSLNKKAEVVMKSVNESEPVVTTVNVLQNTATVVVTYAEGLRTEASRVIQERETLRNTSEKIKSTTDAVQTEISNVIRETSELIEEQQKAEEKPEEQVEMQPLLSKEEKKEEKAEEKAEDKKEETDLGVSWQKVLAEVREDKPAVVEEKKEEAKKD